MVPIYLMYSMVGRDDAETKLRRVQESAKPVQLLYYLAKNRKVKKETVLKYLNVLRCSVSTEVAIFLR